MYAALLQAKNEVTGWFAQMYSAFFGGQDPGLDGTSKCPPPPRHHY
jgi:hypothetical protein